MTTLDELELEMYRAGRDLQMDEAFWYEEEETETNEYWKSRRHYEKACKMFWDAEQRFRHGEKVDNEETKDWIKFVKEMRA